MNTPENIRTFHVQGLWHFGDKNCNQVTCQLGGAILSEATTAISKLRQKQATLSYARSAKTVWARDRIIRMPTI